jgi:hypothetical protein
MRPTLLLQLAASTFLVAFASGCGASLAQPFDQMKSSDMTIYVLQNYTPPAAPAAAPAAPATAPGQPSLTQIIQQGLAQVQQWVPGLQIPGLTPGAAGTPAATPTAPTPQTDPSKFFHNYYILSWKQVTDSGTKSDIATLFGKKSNFNGTPGACFFPNLGFAIANPSGPTADLLVSLSPCSQVQAFNITWPHGSNVGIEKDAETQIDQIVRKVFQGG